MFEFWYGIEPARRAGLIVGTAIIFGLAVLVTVWALRPNYAVLFTDLSEADAAAIVEQLRSMKVDYAIHDQGRTLKVPEAVVYETRMGLTSSGVLLKSGVGFELFDNAEYGMTDFAQKINYQRALQGELARTIGSLSKIKMARVHLVLPESSLFRKKDLEASAAITVVMEQRQTLDDAEVKGIQHLVAASVQELDLSNIVIVDQEGTILSKARSKNSQLLETRLNEKLQLESYLRGKVLSLVDGVFGAGRGVVNVDVTINYDQVQRRIERQVPVLDENGKPLVARSSTTKSVRPSEMVPPRPDGATAANTTATNEVVEQEYRFGQAIEEQVLETGTVSRMTISVLIPGEAGPQQVDQLEKLIMASVGLDVSRGDMLEISALSLGSVAVDLVDEMGNFAGQSGIQQSAVSTPQQVLPQRASPVRSVQIGSYQVRYDYLLYAGGAVGLLIVLSLITFGLRGRPGLTPIQREEVLREVKEWLKSSDEGEARLG